MVQAVEGLKSGLGHLGVVTQLGQHGQGLLGGRTEASQGQHGPGALALPEGPQGQLGHGRAVQPDVGPPGPGHGHRGGALHRQQGGIHLRIAQPADQSGLGPACLGTQVPHHLGQAPHGGQGGLA